MDGEGHTFPAAPAVRVLGRERREQARPAGTGTRELMLFTVKAFHGLPARTEQALQYSRTAEAFPSLHWFAFQPSLAFLYPKPN